MRAPWLTTLLSSALLASALTTAAAERVRVQVMPADQPVLYLQLDNNTLRVAATEDGLAEAKTLNAAYGPGRWDLGQGVKAAAYDFPDTPLPAELPGVKTARVDLTITRFTATDNSPAQWEVSGGFRLSMRDTADDLWTYMIYSSTPGYDPNATASTPDTVTMPLYYDITTMAPRVRAQVNGRQVGLEIQLMVIDREAAGAAGMSTIPAVVNLQRNGKPARARMEVRNAAGKVVAGKNGTADTFAGG